MQGDKEKSEINKPYFLYRVIINKQAPGLKLEFWSHFTDSHRNTMLNYHGLRCIVYGGGVMNSLEHSREV